MHPINTVYTKQIRSYDKILSNYLEAQYKRPHSLFCPFLPEIEFGSYLSVTNPALPDGANKHTHNLKIFFFYCTDYILNHALSFK